MGVELIVDGARIEFRKGLSLKHLNPLDEQNECLPEEIREGKFYKFGINGYVIFPLGSAIPLIEERVLTPLASIAITEQTNFLLGEHIHTRGEYYVRSVRRIK